MSNVCKIFNEMRKKISKKVGVPFVCENTSSWKYVDHANNESMKAGKVYKIYEYLFSRFYWLPLSGGTFELVNLVCSLSPGWFFYSDIFVTAAFGLEESPWSQFVFWQVTKIGCLVSSVRVQWLMSVMRITKENKYIISISTFWSIYQEKLWGPNAGLVTWLDIGDGVFQLDNTNSPAGRFEVHPIRLPVLHATS